MTKENLTMLALDAASIPAAWYEVSVPEPHAEDGWVCEPSRTSVGQNKGVTGMGAQRKHPALTTAPP